MMNYKNNKFPIVLVIVFALSLAVQVLVDSREPQAKNASSSEKNFRNIASAVKGMELKDKNGETISLDKLHDDLVVINFWASWCQPCLEEIPSLVQFSKSEIGKKIKYITISGDEESSKDKAIKVINKYKMNFPVIWDFDGKVFEKFNISAVPVTIVLKKGNVLKVYNEPVDFQSEEFKLKIEDWLKL